MSRSTPILHPLELNTPYHAPALRAVVALIEESLAYHPSPNAKIEGLEGEWGTDIAESWAAMHDIMQQLDKAADKAESAFETA